MWTTPAGAGCAIQAEVRYAGLPSFESFNVGLPSPPARPFEKSAALRAVGVAATGAADGVVLRVDRDYSLTISAFTDRGLRIGHVGYEVVRALAPFMDAKAVHVVAMVTMWPHRMNSQMVTPPSRP